VARTNIEGAGLQQQHQHSIGQASRRPAYARESSPDIALTGLRLLLYHPTDIPTRAPGRCATRGGWPSAGAANNTTSVHASQRLFPSFFCFVGICLCCGLGRCFRVSFSFTQHGEQVIVQASPKIIIPGNVGSALSRPHVMHQSP
jgi:hypothetical protein